MTAPEEPGTGPVIRDNRRIDPATGQPRRGKHAATQPAGASGAGRPGPAASGARHSRNGEPIPDEAPQAEDIPAAAPPPPPAAAPPPPPAADDAPGVGELRTALAERTADLQRLQAEYANYRKRVDRDRIAVREQAVANTLGEMLPILDAIGQAREHGELSGGFKSVADSLQAAVSKLGLVSYGQRGDVFDPKIHEALTHTMSPDVTEDTCVEIFQPGYKVGERIMRPARVAVAAPDGSNGSEWPSGEDNN